MPEIEDLLKKYAAGSPYMAETLAGQGRPASEEM
jgi:hypothetical protein